MKLLMLLSILILTTLNGCALVTKENRASDFCTIARPIHDSPADTQETRLQILSHNAKFACVCEGICPDTDTRG